MSTFTAVVVSHSNEAGLRNMLAQLLYQTRKPDETLVFASGYQAGEFARLSEQFGHAKFFAEDDRRDWGHAKRAAGLERASCEYVGWFNDDDSYEAMYLQEMLRAATAADADVVFCGWNTYPGCDFRLGSSTSGNFIVRTELARQVGYPDTPVYENDGHFIDALAAVADPVVRIPLVLYQHNVQ